MTIVEAAEIINAAILDEAVSPTIKKLVENKDMKGIRYVFLNALDVDPTFENYIDDFNYCKSKGFIDPHKELTPFTNDKSKWNEEYWGKIETDITKNFSEKRMNHLREVAKVFMADKIDRLNKERAAKKAEAERKTAKPSNKVYDLPPNARVTAEEKRRFRDLDEKIAKKDLFMLREALGNTIYGCRDFSDGEFDGAVRYVERHGVKIKEAYDGKPLISKTKPEDEWDGDDFADAIAELKMNFCDERINDVKKIGKKLYPSGSSKGSAKTSEAKATPKTAAKNETVKIRVLLKQLLRDLWELIKSLGSRNFATIRGKWQTLCRNFVNNAKRTSIGKRFAKIFSKTPNSAEEAKEQINAVKTEVDNLNEAATIVKAAMILSEEYQTNKSCAFQENQPESNTPYVHRVDYNFYDPNLMDLKKLPSDEEQDSVTEPS